MKAIITRVKTGKRIGEYRFNLKAKNNKTVAHSGTETYANLKDCEKTLTKYFPQFEIVRNF